MAVFTAWLLKRGSGMKTLTDAGIVIFLLVMMASMFVSAVIYLYVPTLVTAFELVALNMVSMSVGLIPILAALFKGDRPLDETRKDSTVSTRSIVYVAIIALAVLSEAFMGWTFAILSGASSTSQDILSAIVSSMGTYWFIFTMASEMAVTLYLVGRNFPRTFRWLVAIQIVIMVLSPTAISDANWVDWTLWGSSAAMVVAIIVIFEYLYKNRTLAAGALNYVVCLLGAYALMMAGLFVWLLYGDITLFDISIVTEMVIYFAIVLDERKLTTPPLRGWLSMPKWALILLSSVSVSEFFMGGILDIQQYGPTYFASGMSGMSMSMSGSGVSFASLTGPILTVVPAAFYNLVIFVSSVTLSLPFMVMMGVEMGALVLFKIRYTFDMETKIRLLLVLVAYGVYTIFFPMFVFSGSVSHIPWIGWDMGLGTAGALAPAVIGALVGTYIISGGLSFLFGSRQVCSLFCMAATMYQGTTVDAMSSFNRTSKVGSHFLTSRISSAYKIVVSLVWASLLGSAVLSYLTSIGMINVSVFGDDVSFFFYSFYFGFLWYIVWVLIPFVGTYGCSTTGMCGWGAFNQLISRFGLFRLKAIDSNQCANCKTQDCTKVCPVGLNNMPDAFIDKGEFRSFKCIGVGDCVSACPYENVFFFDVRNWVRTKLNLPLPPLERTLSSPVESPIDFARTDKE